MAKFKTQCPLCQAEIHVHSQWAGQQAVCPSCSQTITIPALNGKMTDDLPYITTCPACRATQSVPGDVTGRIKRSCTKCGAAFLFAPDISFPCAEKLPPDRNGNSRIACPGCGRHYILKYTPVNGLIGCPECMSIFAHPDTEDQPSSVKHRPVLLPPVPQPSPAPAGMPKAPAIAASASAPTVVLRTVAVSPALHSPPPAPKPERKNPDDSDIRLQIRPIPRDRQNMNGEEPILLKRSSSPEESDLRIREEEEMVELPRRTQVTTLPDTETNSPETNKGTGFLSKFFDK